MVSNKTSYAIKEGLQKILLLLFHC